jgi:hypothetical protein
MCATIRKRRLLRAIYTAEGAFPIGKSGGGSATMPTPWTIGFDRFGFMEGETIRVYFTASAT